MMTTMTTIKPISKAVLGGVYRYRRGRWVRLYGPVVENKFWKYNEVVDMSDSASAQQVLSGLVCEYLLLIFPYLSRNRALPKNRVRKQYQWIQYLPLPQSLVDEADQYMRDTAPGVYLEPRARVVKLVVEKYSLPGSVLVGYMAKSVSNRFMVNNGFKQTSRPFTSGVLYRYFRGRLTRDQAMTLGRHDERFPELLRVGEEFVQRHNLAL